VEDGKKIFLLVPVTSHLTGKRKNGTPLPSATGGGTMIVLMPKMSCCDGFQDCGEELV
jgi:hypothetical protein